MGPIFIFHSILLGMRRETTYIYGTHPVEEALLHKPESIKRILFQSGADAKQQMYQYAKKHEVPIESFDSRHMPKGVSKDVMHQGVLAEVYQDGLLVDYHDFVSTLEVNPKKCLIVLGEVQDPQNVGSIIRSAAAFGIAGVLIPEHKQAKVNATVIKVSVGMAFRVPLISIGNVNQTLEDLKERGFWIYGLDGESRQSITKESFDAPTVLVVGNEGEGIRTKTKEKCDILLSIPMSPECESLNAGTSTAIAMYQWRNWKH